MPINYSFVAKKITDTTQPITIGTVFNGSLTQPNQRNLFTFDVASATQLMFTNAGTNTDATLTLVGPNGVYFNTTIGGLNNVINVVAGSYTLVVTGHPSLTYNYGYRIVDIGAAQQLQFETVTSGTLNPGSTAIAYRFSGVKGEHISLELINPNSSVSWRVIGPTGANVTYNSFDPKGDVDILPVTGTYTVIYYRL